MQKLPQQNDLRKKLQNLQQNLPPQLVPIYNNLFVNPNPQNLRQSKTLHKQKRIIINGQISLSAFVNGQYINKLKNNNQIQYLKAKCQVVEILILLCKIFRLNSKFIKESYIIQSQQQKVPSIIYIIQQIYSSFQLQVNESVQQYRCRLTQLFTLLSQLNSLSQSHLYPISQNLSTNYSCSSLSLQLVQTSFNLISVGIKQRNVYPFLYFNQNSMINAIKVLFNQPKWIFNKGMTLWIWFQLGALTNQQHTNSSCTLFYIKTDVGHAIRIKFLSNLDLEIHITLTKKETQIVIIKAAQHRICINELTMMGVEFQVQDGGFLKPSLYTLNLRINNFTKISVVPCQKLPKFSTSQMITDFILFDKFIGKVYSIVIQNQNQLSAFSKLNSSFSYYGICSEQYVWAMIQSEILRKESIVCVFNAQRTFQGVLINYVSQNNIACFSGLVSKDKYNKYDYQIVDVLMPFLYFLVIIKNQVKQTQKFNKIFDMVFKHIINLVGFGQQTLRTSQDVLFLGYFLQLSDYSISQSTLNYLIEQIRPNSDRPNVYFSLIGKFLSYQSILLNGLIIQNIQNLQQYLNYQNPVQKIQYMFMLQTKWKQKWNSCQGFNEWYTNKDLKFQINHQFDQKNYFFDQNRANMVQWEVRNFVTNDRVKPLLMPIFKLPQYAQLNKFKDQYIIKQCAGQIFNINIASLKVGKKITLRKYTNSTYGKLKKRFLGNSKQISLGEYSTISNKIVIKQQFITSVLELNLLSAIISSLRLTCQGFLIIASTHTGQSFDHMCIKAFKNELLHYKCIHLSQINHISKHRFNQSPNSLQIHLKNGQIYLFYFILKDINSFLQKVQEFVQITKSPYQMYLQAKEPFDWIQKKMSNYQYIMWLNDTAGRSYMDISQYPIMPWTYVADKNAQNNQSKIYRNLMKNMGSHGSEQRIAHFMEKYTSNNQQQLFNQYHFGTHYSSSAIIFNYLIRIRPFSIGAMTLQSGKFDCADRVFGSYIGSWLNATNSPTDVRQLVPQIYTLPQAFLNINNYDFGLTQEKSRIDNVELAKWSSDNPYKFVSKIRRKLQNSYVSQNINHWIDLTFGYKQRGQQAIDNMNIYFPLTYEDSINLDNIKDLEQKISYETQIAHFGQNPSQVLGNNPHPIRMKAKATWQGRLISDAGQGIIIQRCLVDNKKNVDKHSKFLYNSIFQSRNAIMCINFLDDNNFIVVRKNAYTIFKISSKKSDFITKQNEVKYELETTEISINYKQLTRYVPSTTIDSNLIAIGGFYNNLLQFIFLDQPKCNQVVRFAGLSTVTAISYTNLYHFIYLADNQGQLKVYKLTFSNSNFNQSKAASSLAKEIQFVQINSLKIHDDKVNFISVHQKANMIVSCSNDGYVKIFNLYSQQLMRFLKNPDFKYGLQNAISFCSISVSPLYSVIFYSQYSKKIYSYSINGQFLAQFYILHNEKLSEKQQNQRQSNGFIHNMKVTKCSDTTQKLIFLTSDRKMFILDLPYLKLKRQIKLKKDENKITCFECCKNGKICLTGTQDEGLQIIADIQCF